jgi:hypothetical protein
MPDMPVEESVVNHIHISWSMEYYDKNDFELLDI